MSNTLPWNGRNLYLFLADDKSALDIRTARDGDNANGVFEPSKLEDLFATIAHSGLPMKSQNFVLYGEEKRDGRPIALQAAIKKPYEKDGKTLQGSYAYSAKQIDSFTPVSFIVKTKFIPRRGGGHIPAPLFLAYATPFERSPSEAANGFQRVTAAKVNTTEGEIVKRRTART